MTERETGTLPEKWQGERQTIPIEQICAEADSRLRAPDLGQGLAELADSIARQGLLQPIGVQARPYRSPALRSHLGLSAHRRLLRKPKPLGPNDRSGGLPPRPAGRMVDDPGDRRESQAPGPDGR